MDWGGSLKISTHITQRWPSKGMTPLLNPNIISENSKSWVFAVGGLMVKGKVTHMNQSQPQAVPEYQLKQ